MGVWVARPQLEAGEKIRWRRAANHQQSQFRSVGGRLFITSKRILFQPNIVDRATGGVRWETRLADVKDVEVEEPSRRVPHQGQAATWRRRMKLRTRSGEELFVVNSVDDVAEEVCRLIAATG